MANTLSYLKTLLMESAFAQALKFSAPISPAYSNAVGNRVLLAFFLVGIGLFLCMRFALQATSLSGLPATNFGFVVFLIIAFSVTQYLFINLPVTNFGLRAFSNWTRRERLYLFQVLPLATVVFTVLFKAHLLTLMEQYGVFRFMFFSILTGILWGFIQELIYRGWLQTELTRRYGPIVGLLIANVLFTLGPLHFNLLTNSGGPQWGILAAVFGVGLFFGLVYQRSGNLWLPTILHGIWPLNMS